VLVVFYRAYLAAGDLDPIAALIRAFEARGAAALGLFASSLKAPEARGAIAEWIAALAPAAIVNATAFSARDEGGHSPLDRAGAPVFQLALATAPRAAWEASPRGLSPADLAMHVVLPEIDGRILAGVASFKESGTPDPALGLAPARHRADPDRIAAIVARVEGWMALARRPSPQSLALVLSTYPGKPHLLAHAVGLDALASAQAILADLGQPVPADLATALQHERLTWPLSAYREALATLPPACRPISRKPGAIRPMIRPAARAHSISPVSPAAPCTCCSSPNAAPAPRARTTITTSTACPAMAMSRFTFGCAALASMP
jgi:cobaltochelatase CobN